MNYNIDEEFSREEAIAVGKIKGSKLMDLFCAANKVREKFCGNELHYCTITNAKSGKCSEDCKFCAQSAHYNTKVDTYDLKNSNKIKNEYEEAIKLGSKNFGIVTSGKSIIEIENEYNQLKSFIGNCKKEIDLCVSIGKLSLEKAIELKKSGLTRYHNNIQTAVERYSELISTTHDVYERIESIKNAKEAGLKVCSGGIIGLGETWEDRVSMAFTLKEIEVDTVPLNLLVPIKGTPYENKEILSADEALKTIAMFRLVLKDKVIKIAAGRESILKDFMGMGFLAGANGMLIGGYLTVRGRGVEEDFKFIENIKKMWGD